MGWRCHSLLAYTMLFFWVYKLERKCMFCTHRRKGCSLWTLASGSMRDRLQMFAGPGVAGMGHDGHELVLRKAGEVLG